MHLEARSGNRVAVVLRAVLGAALATSLLAVPWSRGQDAPEAPPPVPEALQERCTGALAAVVPGWTATARTSFVASFLLRLGQDVDLSELSEATTSRMAEGLTAEAADMARSPTDEHAAAIGARVAFNAAQILKANGDLEGIGEAEVDAQLGELWSILDDTLDQVQQELQNQDQLPADALEAFLARRSETVSAVRAQMEMLAKRMPLQPLGKTKQWREPVARVRTHMESAVADTVEAHAKDWQDPQRQRRAPSRTVGRVSSEFSRACQEIICPPVPDDITAAQSASLAAQSIRSQAAGEVRRAYWAQFILVTATEAAGCVDGNVSIVP